MRRRVLTIPATWLLFAAAGAQAQADVSHCVPIEDPASRLACFDAATRSPQRTPTDAATASADASAPGVAVPATAAATSAARADSSNFGLDERHDAAPGKITASVRSVAAHTVPGRWVVTLDNDQVWEQRETTAANRRPRPGDSVTIEQSSFGSYLMVTAGRGSSRVKRIR